MANLIWIWYFFNKRLCFIWVVVLTHEVTNDMHILLTYSSYLNFFLLHLQYDVDCWPMSYSETLYSERCVRQILQGSHYYCSHTIAIADLGYHGPTHYKIVSVHLSAFQWVHFLQFISKELLQIGYTPVHLQFRKYESAHSALITRWHQQIIGSVII